MSDNAHNGRQPGSDLARVVERNIAALLARRRSEEEQKGLQHRIADGITRFTGSMPFVYLHVVIYGSWIAINRGWLPLPKFDPNFFILPVVISIESIFLGTFILISQNHLAVAADRRAELDLHISLLAEHEVTQLITLVMAIARRMGIEEAQDPELEELLHDVAPEKVLDTIEATDSHAERSPRGRS